MARHLRHLTSLCKSNSPHLPLSLVGFVVQWRCSKSPIRPRNRTSTTAELQVIRVSHVIRLMNYVFNLGMQIFILTILTQKSMSHFNLKDWLGNGRGWILDRQLHFQLLALFLILIKKCCHKFSSDMLPNFEQQDFFNKKIFSIIYHHFRLR